MDTSFAIPMAAFLADTPPAAEAVQPGAGSAEKASRNDHVHPRLTSASRVTLDANSTAVVTYTRSFVKAPCVVPTPLNPSGRPVIVEIISDTMTGGVYTGCVLRGSRSQALPTISGLLAAVTTALSNFDPFAASASGVEVSVVAIQQST